MNRESPQELHSFNEGYEPALDINIGEISEEEIRNAIKKLKNNKAAGIDQIQAETLKADIGLSVNILRDLLNKIMRDEVLPAEWKQGVIVKLQKKGQLTDCND